MKNVDKCHARYRRENPVENIIEKIDHKKSNRSSTHISRSIIQQSIIKSRQMITTIMIGLCIGFSTGLRGPHHPRSAVSHHHYAPQKEVKITQDTELLQDATHLKEDIGSMADQLDFSNMTEQEIEFHYFKVHDIDNNAKLDGLEILYAIQHTFHENRLANAERENSNENMKTMDYEDDLPWIVELVDRVLREDDVDHDGYIGYIEYVLGRQRDHIAQAKRNNKSDK
ncbi:multiple coagulation factor deficiency protein 2 homolog isoform X1 [Apis dorsata]|uniref:multiple coagulation factor deficiency protein 2 homolog isoform X1 n=2 Tax=Apis dorsata TaxID=7462 RepID=UPI0003DF63A5|nr:multiple coagulation factor deficiency protein 2 homolog isoform X1 [Apis dorsata]